MVQRFGLFLGDPAFFGGSKMLRCSWLAMAVLGDRNQTKGGDGRITILNRQQKIVILLFLAAWVHLFETHF